MPPKPKPKIPEIKGKKSRDRVKELKANGYETKKVKLANGDTIIYKRKI